MKDSHHIMKRAGWVMVIIGLADIAIMIYCIATMQEYSSSLNIFAVIVGIFLLRGSLKAARIISWLAAAAIASVGADLILVPLLLPFDLIVTYTRLNPTDTTISTVLSLVVLLIPLWLYRELTSQPVLKAMDQAGIKRNTLLTSPTTGFLAGALVAVHFFFFFSLSSFTGGATAEEAKKRAADRVGEGYKFHVSSMNISSSGSSKWVHAIVTAYNDCEIRDIEVAWTEGVTDEENRAGSDDRTDG